MVIGHHLIFEFSSINFDIFNVSMISVPLILKVLTNCDGNVDNIENNIIIIELLHEPIIVDYLFQSINLGNSS